MKAVPVGFLLIVIVAETNDPKKAAKSQLRNDSKHSENAKDDKISVEAKAAVNNKEGKTPESQATDKLQETASVQKKVENTSNAPETKSVSKPTEQNLKSAKASDSDKASQTSVNKKAAFLPVEEEQDEDPDSSFQHGSVKHPAHEMYPRCHHCRKNSSYSECIKSSTLKVCNRGLSNICYTRSVKRDKIIHYEMGCADHNSCTAARAKPCRASEKRCFTCCQWSGCNSQPHHKYEARIAAYASLIGSATVTAGTWALVLASFTFFVLTVVV